MLGAELSGAGRDSREGQDSGVGDEGILGLVRVVLVLVLVVLEVQLR
jgi:hypothetical protein